MITSKHSPVLRYGLREKVPSEDRVLVGSAVGHQREQLLVEGVYVPVAEAVGAVGHLIRTKGQSQGEGKGNGQAQGSRSRLGCQWR